VTTLANRPHTALLVVDVQNGAVADAHERDTVVANIAGLVEKARGAGVPVVWVQHSNEHLVPGSDAWRIVPELTPEEREPLVEKTYGDSFEDTVLENVLAELRVGRLLVVGAQTDACIRSTLHGALVRGYDATLVSDAHTTEDQSAWGAPAPEQVIAHTNLYWSDQTAPGRTAGTVETKDVDFATTRCELREVRDEDLPVLFEQWIDPVAVHMAAFTTPDQTDWDAFERRWSRLRADASVLNRAIVVDGEVAGTIGSWGDPGEREVTYWIGRSHWGKGIATAALSAYLAVERSRQLHARIAYDNVGSRRVLEKCGFRVVGTDRGFAQARSAEIEEQVLRLEP
jgi:nicotinamidase-related amidase/RimJ/RimL family protein N-acetyltransferase